MFTVYTNTQFRLVIFFYLRYAAQNGWMQMAHHHFKLLLNCVHCAHGDKHGPHLDVKISNIQRNDCKGYRIRLHRLNLNGFTVFLLIAGLTAYTIGWK